MTYEEWDRWPERNWATYRITGWVPEDAIGKEQRRTYFHLTVDGAAPDGEWTVKIDNHRFRLFWAPLAAPSPLVEPQSEWLEHVWEPCWRSSAEYQSPGPRYRWSCMTGNSHTPGGNLPHETNRSDEERPRPSPS